MLRAVLMYIHVKSTDIATTSTAKPVNIGTGLPICCWVVPGMKKSGRCQNAHNTPSIRLDTNAFHRSSSRSMGYLIFCFRVV